MEFQFPSKLASFLVWIITWLWFIPSHLHVWPGWKFVVKGSSPWPGIFLGAGLLSSSIWSPLFLTRIISFAWYHVGRKNACEISLCSSSLGATFKWLPLEPSEEEGDQVDWKKKPEGPLWRLSHTKEEHKWVIASMTQKRRWLCNCGLYRRYLPPGWPLKSLHSLLQWSSKMQIYDGFRMKEFEKDRKFWSLAKTEFGPCHHC